MLLSSNCSVWLQSVPAEATSGEWGWAGPSGGAVALGHALGCTPLPPPDMPPASHIRAPRNVPAGFPIHHRPGAFLEAFPVELGQGVIGADFPCASSEVPGMCAFEDTTAAGARCMQLPDKCNAITVFAHGEPPARAMGEQRGPDAEAAGVAAEEDARPHAPSRRHRRLLLQLASCPEV